jgi:hypothetical protein
VISGTNDGLGGNWTLSLSFRQPGRGIPRYALTFPRPAGGQITFPFPLSASLRWLQLPPEASETVTTADDMGSVTLTRVSLTTWKFDFDIRPSLVGTSGRSGFLTVTSDQVEPPWAEFTLDSRVKVNGETYANSFRFKYCNRRGLPCEER